MECCTEVQYFYLGRAKAVGVLPNETFDIESRAADILISSDRRGRGIEPAQQALRTSSKHHPNAGHLVLSMVAERPPKLILSLNNKTSVTRIAQL
jgi:hypothetical protein